MTLGRVIIFCVLSVAECHGAAFRGSGPASVLEDVGNSLLDVKVQAEQADALRKEVGSLIPRINAGGRTAR